MSSPSSCPETCSGEAGDFSCDYWALPANGEWTCAINEQDYGCDCSGCECPVYGTSGQYRTVARTDLSAGDYWVLIEGFAAGDNGNYTLSFDCLSYAYDGDEIEQNYILLPNSAAYYSVIVDDATVLHEKMGRTSASRQSTSFEVVLPMSARTALSENAASQGGGGAVFWEDTPPENLEQYRSSSNSALYGDYVATPARVLCTSNSTYDAVSGISMARDPISVELKDR